MFCNLTAKVYDEIAIDKASPYTQAIFLLLLIQ